MTTTAVGGLSRSDAVAFEWLKLVIALAAAALAILAAAGLVAQVVFADSDPIKYATTILGPLLITTLCVVRDPLRAMVGASIVTAPFAGLVATFAGQQVSVIVPLLLVAVGLAVVSGPRESRPSPLGALAAIAGLLLLIPLLDGEWASYLSLIVTATALAYVVSRVVASGRGGLTFVLGAVVVAGAVQAAIAIWEFQTGNQFNPYSETSQATFGRNYFFGFEDLNRPSAALFDPISLGNVLALSLPVAVILCVAARRTHQRVMIAGAVGVIAIGLVLTFSRMSWIGATVGVIVAVALLPRHVRGRAAVGVALGVLAVLVVAGLTAGPELQKRFDSIASPTASSVDTADGDRERLDLWRGAARAAESRPLTGVGVGDLEPALARQGAPAGPGVHAHSTYLQMLAEAGFLGVLALVLIVVGTLRGVHAGLLKDRLLMAGAGGAVAAVLVVWSTDYTVRYTAVATSMAILVGIAAAQRRRPRPRSQPSRLL